jgi:hypothetical protein
VGEDGPQVPFAEDQDSVGDFGSGGQDEAFGEAVRPRTGLPKIMSTRGSESGA